MSREQKSQLLQSTHQDGKEPRLQSSYYCVSLQHMLWAGGKRDSHPKPSIRTEKGRNSKVPARVKGWG